MVQRTLPLCGNIAHAFPTADPPAALIACDARVRLATRGGEREVRAEDFFVGDGMPVYTLAGSAMEAAAQAVGLRVVPEFFADRPLRGDGSVVMFRWWEAFEASPEIVASRAVRASTDRVVRALDGREVPVVADTICVHSDTPGAGAIGPAVRRALEDAGVTVTAEAASGREGAASR